MHLSLEERVGVPQAWTAGGIPGGGAAQAKLWRCRRAVDGLVPHRRVETQFLVMGLLKGRVRAQALCLNPTFTYPMPPSMSF